MNVESRPRLENEVHSSPLQLINRMSVEHFPLLPRFTLELHAPDDRNWLLAAGVPRISHRWQLYPPQGFVELHSVPNNHDLDYIERWGERPQISSIREYIFLQR